jgi:isochorismate pyruvate lyase
LSRKMCQLADTRRRCNWVAMQEPEQCQTMAEVRAGVDALDEQIVSLLAKRFQYMDAAARIKPHREQVRDEPRKAAVISHAQGVARKQGVSPTLVAELYERVVEASIAYELERFDSR